MPSLRNPVGPLPASIYWRRRIVVLAALGAAVALVCALTLGGGGNDRKAAAGSAGTPASSLTPGPTGRGGSNDGAAGGAGGSGTPSTGATGGSGTPTTVPTGAPVVTGSGGASGGGSDSGTSGSGSGSGSGGSSSGSGGGGSALVPNQTGTKNLPTCVATDLDLSLVSNHQIYGPSQLPAFTLTITNTADFACKVDLGAKSAVLSVTSDTGATVWSSGFCPKDPSEQWYSLPASVPGAHPGTLSALFGWGRTTAKAGCAPGSGGGNAQPGTYVAHVAIGSSVQPYLSFKLAPFGS